MNKIEYIVGDVRSQPFKTKRRFIPHVCNDEGRMGAGVAKALYTKWPTVIVDEVMLPLIKAEEQS